MLKDLIVDLKSFKEGSFLNLTLNWRDLECTHTQLMHFSICVCFGMIGKISLYFIEIYLRGFVNFYESDYVWICP